MTLNEYFKSRAGLSVGELATEIGVKSPLQIRQWQHGYAKRKPGPTYCIAIEKATNGLVTRKELRPTDYHLIWPDLAEPQKEPAHV